MTTRKFVVFSLSFALLSVSLFGESNSADLFAAKADIRYASGFSVEYHNTYKIVHVTRPWAGATSRFDYVLVERGTQRPTIPGVPALNYVEIPVRSAVSFASNYLPEITALGSGDTVVGVDSASTVFSPEIRKRLDTGAAKEVTKDWNPNIELLVAMAPDIIFTYGMGDAYDSYPKLSEVGLPVAIDGDWNEQTALGRSEWIKFIALFYDKEAAAEQVFSAIERNYQTLTTLAATAATRPSVVVNAPFQGVWTVSGGASFMARYLKDAAARYLWNDDDSTGGVSLSVEAVYARAGSADFWVNPGAAETLAAVKAFDSRFATLPAVANGNVYNAVAQTLPGGANDYFESGVLYADRVLGDLIEIFHPELLPDRKLTYYVRLR